MSATERLQYEAGRERAARAEFDESEAYTDAIAEWAAQDPGARDLFERTSAYERAFQNWRGR